MWNEKLPPLIAHVSVWVRCLKHEQECDASRWPAFTDRITVGRTGGMRETTLVHTGARTEPGLC